MKLEPWLRRYSGKRAPQIYIAISYSLLPPLKELTTHCSGIHLIGSVDLGSAVTLISLPSSISALNFTPPTVYSLDSCGTEMPNGRIRVFRVLRLFEIFLICQQPLVATFFKFFLDRAMSYVLEIKIQMNWVSELNLDHHI